MEIDYIIGDSFGEIAKELKEAMKEADEYRDTKRQQTEDSQSD